jgi:hypothetical protein
MYLGVPTMELKISTYKLSLSFENPKSAILIIPFFNKRLAGLRSR